MAAVVFNKGLFEIASALTDLDSADLRVLLVKSGYTPSPTSNFVADIVASELSVSSYARQALANKSVVEDDSNHRAYLDADDLVFGSLGAGQTIVGAIVFRHTGSDATAPLVLFVPIPNTATGGPFTLQWAAAAAGGICFLRSAS